MPTFSPISISRKLKCPWCGTTTLVHAWRGKSPEFMQAQVGRLEAVIREAMQKTLDEAERATAHLSCDYCKAVRQVPAIIRSLKQSNSGMEACMKDNQQHEQPPVSDFLVKVRIHTGDAAIAVKTPEVLQHAIGEALDKLGIAEEVDYTLEVSRLHERR